MLQLLLFQKEGKSGITVKKRKIWVKTWLRRRNYLGIYNTLVQEFQTEDRFEYSTFLRMLPEHFEELSYLITESIEKEGTVMRDPIPARVKLAAAIQFLSTIFELKKNTSHDSE